jgi:hypothetical protein
MGSPSAFWVHLNLDTTISAGVKQSGTIQMKTPMFKYLSAPLGENIKVFIYSRSKMVSHLTYPLLSTVLVEQALPGVVIVASDSLIGADSDYSLSFTLPHLLPSGAVLII